jgi:hypothetical protein
MKYLERGFSSGIGWLTEKNSKKMAAFCRILIWSIYGEIKWNTTSAISCRETNVERK